MSGKPIDAAAREEALDPTRSFIVQAPAGSGKTELLTRRVLTLLATVERPDDVVAITFTRKAAAEMRERVVVALRRAADPADASDPYEAEGLAIARAALARDHEQGWQLLDDPSQLALRTIDSFATTLAHRLPVLSALGGAVAVTDDAESAHREAAERFLEHGIGVIPAVAQRLDNRLDRLRDRLVDLLRVRDQWQAYVQEDLRDDKLRTTLESMLAALVASRMQAAQAIAPPGLGSSLACVLKRCGEYLSALEAAGEFPDGLEDRHRSVIALADTFEHLAGQLPTCDAEGLPAWRSVSRFLITTTGTWRKGGDKHAGVPAKSAAKKLGVPAAQLEGHKAALVELLQGLGSEETLLELLIEIGTLPDPQYLDADWALLGELGAGLQQLLLELQLVFAERRQLDFVEIAARAARALGSSDQPTDLALSLDLKLRHLLVDEFQDTSHTQFALFERLVDGWEPGDGRTFFAVGDPMQSIYRFRQGDVGLFLRAVRDGIGPVALVPLKLSVNFRSVAGVIGWVNRSFSVAFPKHPDRDIGAVTYEPSNAFADAAPYGDNAVTVHLFHKNTAVLAPTDTAGERVADLVAEALAQDEHGTVGILLRARTHAPAVVGALRARGIAYRAVEIDRLGDRPVVRDLIALALALRYPHDRISWLALLRGPMCGLRLADLHALFADSVHDPLLQLSQDDTRLARVSEDGRVRLARFIAEVLPARQQAARGQVAPWIEALWLRLGGPAICHTAAERDAAQRALNRLYELEAEDGLWRRDAIEAAMARLFAGEATDPAAARVQIMTLHKSKGLEFDSVILPALAASGRGNDARLLDWYETSVSGRQSLLLAPIDAPYTRDSQRSAIGKLLRGFRSRADEVERVRQLYVACTRARSKLHLVATLDTDSEGAWKPPASNSLLAPLWPAIKDSVSAPPAGARPSGEEDVAAAPAARAPIVAPPFERTRSGWKLPEFDRFEWQYVPPAKAEIKPIEYSWSGTTARDIGTVVHRALQRLAALPAGERVAPDSEAIARHARELRTLGITDAQLDDATGSVVIGIRNTLEHERGRWLLDDVHVDARCEWALSIPQVVDGRLVDMQRIIIDRTFIDADGTRWIVDYKTGSHQGGLLEEFLDREVDRYRDQLENYAHVMREIEPDRPIRVGLWFPMVQGWREFVPVNEDGTGT